jgi:hypothetical protein
MFLPSDVLQRPWLPPDYECRSVVVGKCIPLSGVGWVGVGDKYALLLRLQCKFRPFEKITIGNKGLGR